MGRWLWRGYLHTGGYLIGRWRDTCTPEHLQGKPPITPYKGDHADLQVMKGHSDSFERAISSIRLIIPIILLRRKWIGKDQSGLPNPLLFPLRLRRHFPDRLQPFMVLLYRTTTKFFLISTRH